MFTRGPAAAVFVSIVLTLTTTASAGTPEILVSSFFSNAVDRYDLSDASHNGALLPGAASLVNPLAARVGPDGLLYVASEGNDEIQRYNPQSGAFVDVFVTAGSGGLDAPTGMTWGPDGEPLCPQLCDQFHPPIRRRHGRVPEHLRNRRQRRPERPGQWDDLRPRRRSVRSQLFLESDSSLRR